MASKYVRTDWETFSRKFVAFQRLPYGTELRLFHADGRKARTDLQVMRRPVRGTTTRRLEPDETVSALREVALGLLATDFKARRLDLQLYGPDGEVVKGNTRLSTVRKLPPAPTQQEQEQQENEAALVAQLQDSAQGAIAELEYLIEDPTTTVCPAVVNALVQRYGRRSVVQALGR